MSLLASYTASASALYGMLGSWVFASTAMRITPVNWLDAVRVWFWPSTASATGLLKYSL